MQESRPRPSRQLATATGSCGDSTPMAGTFVQFETVSLSRDIPFGLGWVIGPFVTSVPKESLLFTLETLRRRVSTATVATRDQ